MAKYSAAAFETFLVDGYDMRGAQPKGVSLEVTNVVQTNTHGVGDKWTGASAVGVLSATFSQTGAYFDDAVSGMHDAWKALTQVVRLVGLAMFGNTIGKRFIGTQGVYAGKYALGPKVDALVNADAGYVVSGAIDVGVIVQNWVQRAANWNTFTDGFPCDYTLDPDNLAIPITSNTLASPTVVTTPVPHGLSTNDVILISGNITSVPAINAQQIVTKISATQFSLQGVNCSTGGTGGQFVRASTNNGGVGYQFVSQYAGITGLLGKIRSSADNITYADLPTVFANVTGPPPDATAAQRIVVAGVIARYLCSVGTFTGAGTCTPLHGFKRNPPQ